MSALHTTESNQCQFHASQIRELELSAAKTEVHLNTINETLTRLDKKLDRLDSKVEGLVVAKAEDSGKEPFNWKSHAMVAGIALAVAWGPKFVLAVAAIFGGH
jgi:uncharacterized coiled-coil protein SlyX